MDDRPREKLLLRGPQNLSNAELLAILLRTGTKDKSVIQISQELINKHESLAQLAMQSVDSLKNNRGIGSDKAAALVAAFEISKRIDLDQKWYSGKTITNPKQIADIFIPLLRDEIKERFIVVCLNASNRIIKFETITIGLLNCSLVHAREVFKVAIENNSAFVILVHNHPGGNLEPSNVDKEVTNKLVEAGKILGIEVFDHIIVSNEGFTSFVDKKLI